MKSAATVGMTIVLCIAGICAAQNAPAADPYKNALTYEYGKSRADLASIEDEIRKASPEQYPAIEAKLIAMLKDAQAGVEARRFACRMLQVTGSAKCVPVIAPLLADEKISHAARIALETMRDPGAGAAIRDALGQAKGKLLAGMIGTVAARRDAQAVPALTALTANSDPTIAGAALTALGQIGTIDAAKALGHAKVAEALKPVQSRALVEAASALAQSGNKADALLIFKPFASDVRQPSYVRTAAFRGMAESQDAAASAKAVAAAASGEDVPLRTAALSLLLPTADRALRLAVAEQLPSLPPEAQALLLPVLADQKDIALRPMLLGILKSTRDVPARAAALEAMVYHGQGEDVAMLAKAAAGETDNSPTRKTLARMNAQGIDEALIVLLADADAKVRVVVVGVLADRRSGSALPAIVKAVGDQDSAVVNEAIKALSNVGTPAEVPGLVQIAATTTDNTRRDGAANAIKSIASRAAEKSECSKPVVAALASTTASPAKVALLQILPRLGDEASLSSLRLFIGSNEIEIRDAAIRALSEWPALEAGPALVNLARSTNNETHAILALHGCVRLVRSAKERGAVERIDLLKSVLATAKRAEEKKQAVAALADVVSPESLPVLRSYLKEPELQTDAALATIRLARDMGAIGGKASIAALEEVKSLPVNDAVRKQADAAIEIARQAGMSDGFIISWLLAGPFTQEGKDGGALFDAKFAPETNGSAQWRPVSAGDKKIVDLGKVVGGDNRVAYLKTLITSDTDQDALLELGSDDGIKVFVNGQQVHAKNASRPVRAGEDKAKIKLKKGSNTILLKVSQGGGDWGAIARLRGADGKEIKGAFIGLGQD